MNQPTPIKKVEAHKTLTGKCKVCGKDLVGASLDGLVFVIDKHLRGAHPEHSAAIADSIRTFLMTMTAFQTLRQAKLNFRLDDDSTVKRFLDSAHAFIDGKTLDLEVGEFVPVVLEPVVVVEGNEGVQA